MTLVSNIIKRAYRKTNLIPAVASPNANQTTEALEMLNPLISSIVGNEVGSELTDFNYDPSGDYDQSYLLNGDQWVPDNSRLVLNLTGATTVLADPYPYEGQRLAVVDVAGNLATNNLIIDGNGRLIEGAATVTLSTNSESRQWLYRADTGNWVKIEELEAADTMPFPVEFDPYFVLMLAVQLNPMYGQTLSPHDTDMLRRMRSQLRARYANRNDYSLPDFGVTNPKDLYNYGYNSNYFNQGYFWPRYRP